MSAIALSILMTTCARNMKIKSLTMEELKIPFKQAFSHASATRKITQAVLVRAQSENGLIAYGEGCPRSYVTSETTATAQQFFEKHKADIVRLESLDDLSQWLQSNQQTIDHNPTAWCAIELALLDSLAKETQQSVESLLSLPELSATFQYTAVLGADEMDSFKRQLQDYLNNGFKDYKIKVSGDLTEDKQKIDIFRQLGVTIQLRLDANNIWQTTEQAIDYISTMGYPFCAVEEPLQANDYDNFRTIYHAFNTPIILDESFLRLAQFSAISNDPEKWIINLRISKMGGILRSLAIVQKARQTGIPVIIGAQVGETSILTRAALTVANACRDILLAQEGAFGSHLLEWDVIDNPIMFGKNGALQPQFCGDGFGLNIQL